MMIQNTPISISRHSPSLVDSTYRGEEIFAPKPVKPTPQFLASHNSFSITKKNLSDRILPVSEAPRLTTSTVRQQVLGQEQEQQPVGQWLPLSPVTMSPKATLEMEAGLEIAQILQGSTSVAEKVSSLAHNKLKMVGDDEFFNFGMEDDSSGEVVDTRSRNRDGPSIYTLDEEDYDEVENNDNYYRMPSINDRHIQTVRATIQQQDFSDSFPPHCREDYLGMTPPTRADNTIYLDARFCNDLHFAHFHRISPNDHEGAELDLIFSFSPPQLCSSH